MKITARDPRWKAASAGSTVESLRKALEAIDYLPNAVSAWMEAHGGNAGLAKKNEAKLAKAQEILTDVLMSLPMAVEYTVFGLDVPFKFKDRETFIKSMKQHGIRYTGTSGGSSSVRPEIQSQPTFDKLVGPMYGGPGIARYETSKMYEQMSR